jgi:hypothetical protein
MLDALLITRTQGEMTAALHETESELAIEASADGLMALVMAQHRANFELWHEEDKARVPGVADAEIARNDLMEKMDAWLIESLEQDDAAPLHSETPGLMIDRLSILELKIYHTREEARRASATESHRLRNAERLSLLEEQREDLAWCLDVLWAEVLKGTRRFKLYRQMKMYNDPELNPAVYSRSQGQS